MLSDFIIRSTAAFGGAPFRSNKCTALTSVAGGSAGGAAAGGVPGALVGGALGLAGSLIGGLFGKSNTNKTNKMNYKIMQEQNQFNREEATIIVLVEVVMNLTVLWCHMQKVMKQLQD